MVKTNKITSQIIRCFNRDKWLKILFVHFDYTELVKIHTFLIKNIIKAIYIKVFEWI